MSAIGVREMECEMFRRRVILGRQARHDVGLLVVDARATGNFFHRGLKSRGKVFKSCGHFRWVGQGQQPRFPLEGTAAWDDVLCGAAFNDANMDG
jgi:hypothetical protein